MKETVMATPTFTADGSKATTAAKLDAAIFDVVPESHELLKRVYTAYLSNGRTRNAVTLKRGEVSGGGKKPWKQKGTGRARFGSSRVPIWRGGGIAFGPTGDENYIKQINVKSKRLAVRQALSLSAVEERIIVIATFAPENGKTTAARDLLAKVGASRKTLLVVDGLTNESVRSTANLSDVKLVDATYLNVYDIMNADSIVITNDALKAVSTWLQTEKKTEVTA